MFEVHFFSTLPCNSLPTTGIFPRFRLGGRQGAHPRVHCRAELGPSPAPWRVRSGRSNSQRAGSVRGIAFRRASEPIRTIETHTKETAHGRVLPRSVVHNRSHIRGSHASAVASLQVFFVDGPILLYIACTVLSSLYYTGTRYVHECWYSPGIPGMFCRRKVLRRH